MSWLLNFILIQLLAITFINGQFEDYQPDLDEGWFTEDMYNSPYFTQLRNQGYGLIVPGTKWCGEGDKAENLRDLGSFNETDACCRDHDNCKDIMKPGETKYNLTNPSSSTSLSCQCDRDFYSCLKKSQDYASKTIGTLYFDLLQKPCYDKLNGKYVWIEPVPFSQGRFIRFLRQLL